MSIQSPFIDGNRQLGSGYPVELPVFQGPLDLLLHLIEQDELDISEVSLVAVTDQYVRTIEQMEEIEPGAMADFLVVASKLLYIKSRSLLPQPRPPDDEDEEESSDALLRQLIEYRQFKEVAAALRTREDLGLRVYVRSAPAPSLERRLDLSNVDLGKLHTALRRALQRMPADPPLPSVRAYTVTVAEQVENIRELISQLRAHSTSESGPATVTFGALLSRSRSRIEVIVTFLAVLELIKQRELQAVQDDTFGEIVLAPADDGLNVRTLNVQPATFQRSPSSPASQP